MPAQVVLPVLSQLALASRLSLGIVALLSSLPKLRRPSAFAQRVAEYELLPSPIVRIVSAALILAEAFLAVAFLTGLLIDVALPLAIVTLVIFIVAVSANLRRGRTIRCGCFGDGNEQISSLSIARLLLLLTSVLFLTALRVAGGATSLGAVFGADGKPISADVLQAVLQAVFLLLLGMWILRLPELFLIARGLRWSQASPRRTELGRGKEAT